MQIVLSEELQTIIQLVASGKKNEEIGQELNYSVKTVERRIKTLFNLYKVQNRVQLTAEYMAERLS